ncbi:hypothetical protein METHP14_100010 [Pseudomonas sp. P14-2025]
MPRSVSKLNAQRLAQGWGSPPFELYLLVENIKGPPLGEPFLILRMVRHEESKKLVNN